MRLTQFYEGKKNWNLSSIRIELEKEEVWKLKTDLTRNEPEPRPPRLLLFVRLFVLEEEQVQFTEILLALSVGFPFLLVQSGAKTLL